MSSPIDKIAYVDVPKVDKVTPKCDITEMLETDSGNFQQNTDQF